MTTTDVHLRAYLNTTNDDNSRAEDGGGRTVRSVPQPNPLSSGAWPIHPTIPPTVLPLHLYTTATIR
ncbi:hypothetical protein D9611_000567 [Ephemerocybe angulata]|uniref:Uncharacterized protein n=1 Tax=Ephemerocybe angulata TaxID=980116 RepID=A0A8H5BM59_9AGAR|nr:hypothetical protein D9611_000567 [Tulosesus angulatus]